MSKRRDPSQARGAVRNKKTTARRAMGTPPGKPRNPGEGAGTANEEGRRALRKALGAIDDDAVRRVLSKAVGAFRKIAADPHDDGDRSTNDRALRKTVGVLGEIVSDDARRSIGRVTVGGPDKVIRFKFGDGQATRNKAERHAQWIESLERYLAELKTAASDDEQRRVWTRIEALCFVALDKAGDAFKADPG
jgi:hypothetical protein